MHSWTFFRASRRTAKRPGFRARWVRRLLPLLARPRSAVLTGCASAVLAVLAISVFADEGPPMRGVAIGAILVGLACVVDNVCNVLSRHNEEEARARTLETAWLEAHIELALLRRRVQDHGLDIETHRLANEELQRQLSLPSPPTLEDGNARA